MPDGPDSIAVHDICDRMMSQGLCASRFHHQDLRRTAETRMAEIGISKDIRAQIQSHGLGGVQARHYDMYDYFRRSVKRWSNGGPTCSNVRKLRRLRSGSEISGSAQVEPSALQRSQSSRLAAAMSALVFPEGWPRPDRCAPRMSALGAFRSFAASGRPKPAVEASVEGV